MVREREYRIKSTGRGSYHYGVCEFCGKNCDEHFTRQWRYVGRVGNCWSITAFGHLSCLKTGDWANAPVFDSTNTPI